MTENVTFLLQQLISPFDGIPNLFNTWMIVEPGGINFLVTHCIHYRHQITGAFHRIGRESMASAVQHK